MISEFPKKGDVFCCAVKPKCMEVTVTEDCECEDTDDAPEESVAFQCCGMDMVKKSPPKTTASKKGKK